VERKVWKVGISLAVKVFLFGLSVSSSPNFLLFCLLGFGVWKEMWIGPCRMAHREGPGRVCRESPLSEVSLGGSLWACAYVFIVGRLLGIARWPGRYQSWSCRAAVGQEASSTFELEKWWRRWRQWFWWGAAGLLPEGTLVENSGVH
jgi:hypothetical protein